jgi:hypothetical protein
MTPEQRAAKVMANVACALVELAAMQADNAIALAAGQAPRYTGADMTRLIDHHGIAHGQVLREMEEAPYAVPADTAGITELLWQVFWAAKTVVALHARPGTASWSELRIRVERVEAAKQQQESRS